MFYSKSKNGFYDQSINGENMPDDVVIITDSEYRALMDGQNQGKQIQADENGRPILVDPPPVPAAERRASTKRAVDTAAGNARARYVSAGQLIEEEYRLALQQTQQWRAAGNPPNSVPQAIQDWATATGITAEEAAVSIEQTAAAWETVLLTIRKLRLDGKVAVDNAADDADLAAIAQPYIDQLNAMKP